MLGMNLRLYSHVLNDKSSRFIYNDTEMHYFLQLTLISVQNIALYQMLTFLMAKWHAPVKSWLARNRTIIIFKYSLIRQYFHNKRDSGLSVKNPRIRYIFYIPETNSLVGE